MNIALVGYGKMGRLIEALALEAGHKVLAVVDPYLDESKTPKGSVVHNNINDLPALGEKIDAAIEFTRPDTAVENLLFLAKAKIPAVTGTTGWYDKLPEVRQTVCREGALLFWAPNFSLGMNLFYRLAEYAAEIFDSFSEYDAGGFEIHHSKKADSPSGTAKAIAEKMLAKMKRKKKTVYQMLDRPPALDELHFASLRTGSVPGIHSVVFDSAADTVELTHRLRNREGLAAGALKAAEWLSGFCGEQGRAGVFTMDDMLGDILKTRSES